MQNTAAVPTFSVHIETLARKKREEETEGKQRAARVGTWKYENYWGSMVFIISICSANRPVYLFMCPVLWPPSSVCIFSVGMFPASSYFANVIPRADVCQQSSNHNDCLRFRKQFPHTYFYACWGYCHSNQKVRNPESDYFLKHVLFEMEPSKIIRIRNVAFSAFRKNYGLV